MISLCMSCSICITCIYTTAEMQPFYVQCVMVSDYRWLTLYTGIKCSLAGHTYLRMSLRARKKTGEGETRNDMRKLNTYGPRDYR